MKIAILSRSRKCYSTHRLREAALARGHKVRVLDTMKFSIGVEEDSPELYYRGKPLSTYDAVLPRIGQSITFFGCAVVRQFEQMGVYTANESLAIGRSRDKLRSMQVLSRHEIGIPATAFVRDKNDIIPAIERVGGAPVIIKLLEGTQGVGVILADTNKIAEAIIQTLHGTNQNVLIQNFVKESKGKDIRAIVVGDRVVGAMRRRATGDEFRSNVHRGGTVEVVELDEEFEKVAIKAAQIMGLRVAGVDMLEAEEGPQILEINSSPGLEGIERATQKDIAGAIIEDMEHQVSFPDVDLRQRLRLAAGFSVAEFEVHNIPEIQGKPLRETTLSQQNIQVLHISRPDSVIPNPKGDEVILEGDHLLCYGEISALKSLVLDHVPKKKKKKKTSKS